MRECPLFAEDVSMQAFLQQHKDRIAGTLEGFDRLLFRGTLPSVNNLQCLVSFLQHYRIRYMHFGSWVEHMSERIVAHARQVAAKLGRPIEYLASPKISKDEYARKIQQRDGITQGLVCVLVCVETCSSYAIQGNRAKQSIHPVPAQRKCRQLYFYYIDPEFGWMFVRLQTWLPFPIQVYVNGREYLARQLDKAGINYLRKENGFTQIDNLPRAQALLDQLTTYPWQQFLQNIARQVQPWLDETYGFDQHGYYWTAYQSEYATDLLFRSVADLKALYPKLVNYALEQFQAPDVLRFLGRKKPGYFVDEVASDVCRRSEGIRVKHRAGSNTVKMYDKHGSILRIETTINNPPLFRVRRCIEKKGQLVWCCLPLRKGVADMRQRVAVRQAVNARYLNALAVVHQPRPVAKTLDPVCHSIKQAGRPYRGLRPWTPDEAALFQAVLSGEHALRGFSNQDIPIAGRHQHYTPEERKRLSAKVSRLLRLLRAHGMIRKVPCTRRYHVTSRGHQVMSTTLQVRAMDVTVAA